MVESRFDRALEQEKAGWATRLQESEHRHENELERIRFEVSKLSHRVQGIHDKEIEVLSEAWKKLKAAEGMTFRLVTPFSKSTDYDGMPEEALREAVERLPFSNFHKQELVTAPAGTKNALYTRLMGFKKHNDSEAATTELNNFVLDNAPFLSEELKALFEKVVVALGRTAITDEVGRKAREIGGPFQREFIEWEEVGPLVRQVEQLIRVRLRYSEA